MKSYKELSVKAKKLAMERKRSGYNLFPLGLQAECLYELMAEEIIKLEERLEKLENRGSKKVDSGGGHSCEHGYGSDDDYFPEPSYDHSWDPHYRG
jgi:hypothetical protein